MYLKVLLYAYLEERLFYLGGLTENLTVIIYFIFLFWGAEWKRYYWNLVREMVFSLESKKGLQ